MKKGSIFVSATALFCALTMVCGVFSVFSADDKAAGSTPNFIPQNQMTAHSPWYPENAKNVIDGNRSTAWVLQGADDNNKMPFISLNLGGKYLVSEMHFRPRLNGNGNATTQCFNACALYISTDSTDGIDGTWYRVFKGRTGVDWLVIDDRVIKFDPIEATYVRWRFDGGNANEWTAITEIFVVQAPAGTAPVTPPKEEYMDEEAYWNQYKPIDKPNQVPREGMKAYGSWKDNPPEAAVDATRAIDGNLRTGWGTDDKKHNPYIVIDMGKEYTINTVRYQPWTSNSNQDIKSYSIHVCNDFNRETMTGSWTPVAFGTFTQPWQYRGEKATGFKPVTVRYLMFRCEDEPAFEAICEFFIEQYVPDDKKQFLSPPLLSKVSSGVVMYVDNTTSYVKGKYSQIEPDNFIVRPFVMDGRTLVPVRYIAESFSAKVDWNDASQIVSITLAGKTTTLKIGENKIYVNGAEKDLDVPAATFHGRTFVPLRSIVEALGKHVFWDDRGLIVISDREGVFNTATDSELITELVNAKYKGIVKPVLTDVQPVPDVDDANARKEAFSRRNMPESIDELGKKFFAMVDLEKPEMTKIKAMVNNSQYSEALKAFRDYFMDKAPSLNWLWTTLDAFEYPYEKGETVADELIYNITTPSSRSSRGKLDLGNPGSINWAYDLKLDTENSQFPTSYPIHIDQFFPLVEAYIASSNSAYIEKFFDYVDDLLLNREGLDTRYAINSGYNSDIQSVRGIAYFVRYLCWLSNILPQKGREIPETTLARLLLHRMIDYIPVSMVYGRNNSQNWANDISEFLIAAGLILDDFKLSEFYISEGLDQCKGYGIQSVMPDGSEAQMFFEGYNQMFIHTGLLKTRELLEIARPDLLTPELTEFIDNKLRGKVEHYGRYYVGYTGSGTSLLHKADPNLYEHPALGTIFKRRDGVELKAGETTPFTSDAFPFQGVYLFRDGWPMSQSQYGRLKASNGTGGHHAIKATNEFTLNAYGQALLKGPWIGAYDIDDSPMAIDGSYKQGPVNPANNTLIVGLGHKNGTSHYFEHGLKKDNRWLSTDHIGFAEGIYNKAFGAPGKPDITDVTHNRMVTMLKEHGVWIITDRIDSGSRHDFAFKWLLPITPVHSSAPKAFEPDNIILDKANRTIKTNQPDIVNLSMYQFSNAGIDYATDDGVLAKNKLSASANTSLREISSKISGEGGLTLLTVAYPRKTSADELVSVTSVSAGDSVTAAEIKMSDGSTIWYALSADGKKSMSIGGIQATAESLLIAQNKSGVISGMVVGCDQIGGAQIEVGGSFAFKVSGGSVQVTEYIRPALDLVDINPGANVFSGSVDVTLESKDENVDIRYTINGESPTLSSKLYTGPFTLSSSSIVKAKAFRKGVTAMPMDGSCTQVSELSIAYFEKVDISPAVQKSNLVNGVKYKYYEGNWKDLITFNDYVEPKKEGTSTNIIDISERETEHYFAFKYEGYLDVPADGTYTFHAQDEYTKYIEDAGYELQVIVDGKQWNPQHLLHGFGTWSIPLAQGLHTFEVRYMDYRSNNARVNLNAEGYKERFVNFDRNGTLGEAERKNFPGTIYRDIVWNGTAPKLQISGPGMEKQVLPESMLYRDQ